MLQDRLARDVPTKLDAQFLSASRDDTTARAVGGGRRGCRSWGSRAPALLRALGSAATSMTGVQIGWQPNAEQGTVLVRHRPETSTLGWPCPVTGAEVWSCTPSPPHRRQPATDADVPDANDPPSRSRRPPGTGRATPTASAATPKPPGNLARRQQRRQHLQYSLTALLQHTQLHKHGRLRPRDLSSKRSRPSADCQASNEAKMSAGHGLHIEKLAAPQAADPRRGQRGSPPTRRAS